MSGHTRQEDLAHKAHMHFVADVRAREIDHRIKSEEHRHDEMVVKTARLRELRLAKEAAEREVAWKTKPAKRTRK
jgi:hypothetical protein